MPTTRPRHTLTETADVARALDDAALTWPELHAARGALLRKLVEAGAASVHNEGGPGALLRGAAGAASGTYPRDVRAALLAEWPE